MDREIVAQSAAYQAVPEMTVRDHSPERDAARTATLVRDNKFAHPGRIAEHRRGAVCDDKPDAGTESGQKVSLNLCGVTHGHFVRK
jgi:hypothetical protein